MANKITTKELKKIIPLLHDSFEIKIVDEGILITGISYTPDMPNNTVNTFNINSSKLCIPSLITDLLGNNATTIAKCKDFIQSVNECPQSKNDLDSIRKWCINKGSALNAALCSVAKSKGYTFNDINNAENELIKLNI